MSNQVINPPNWPRAKGYANGVLSEQGTLYIAGQIGWTPEGEFKALDFLGQLEQALNNILDIVKAAGGGPEHIVRLTWFVKDKTEYAANQAGVGEVYRRVLGRNFPAMSLLVVQDLLENQALLEIEATAELPQA
ncbi:MAG: RidA family protein [Pseudomonadota bacterium]